MNDPLQGVIGGSGEGNHGVAGAKNAEKRRGNGMGAAHEVMANHGVLGAEHLTPDLVENLSAPVVVAVAAASGEKAFAYAVVDEGAENLFGIVAFDFGYAGKGLFAVRKGTLRKRLKARVDIKKLTHF